MKNVLSELTAELAARAQTQSDLNYRVGQASLIRIVLGWGCVLCLGGFLVAAGISFHNFSPWLFSQPGFVLLGIASLAVGITLTLAIAALTAFDGARTIEVVNRLRLTTLDLPLMVQQGLYRFVGGTAEEFEHARGQISLCEEINKTEKDLADALERGADTITRALHVWDRQGGLKNITIQGRQLMALAQVFSSYLETRGDLPLGRDVDEKTQGLEAMMKDFLDQKLRPANQTPAE